MILEELEHALKRGAKIYGEIAGYSMLSDGGDDTSSTGKTMERAMRSAIRQSGLSLDDFSAVYADASGFRQFD